MVISMYVDISYTYSNVFKNLLLLFHAASNNCEYIGIYLYSPVCNLEPVQQNEDHSTVQ